MIKQLLGLVTLVLAVLALPVILVCVYDQVVLGPKRPLTAEGVREPEPRLVRIAYNLLPVVLIAAAVYIGVPVVFSWLKKVAEPLSWLTAPVALWCAIDSWLFAPRRAIDAGTTKIADPPLLRAAYMILPVLVVAVIVRMISAETLDFSLVLLVLSVATGAVWAIDHFLFRKSREAAAAAAKPAPLALPEPGTVDYARSFFPVAFIVLLVRAFIFEPFRIPSDSMMPTLLDGDFIVVNKYAYGLRWPVINEKFVDLGSPQRGDVVVFRYPRNPSINYIKRLVGLPGDRIEVHDDQLIINGEAIPLVEKGRYTDGCYIDLRLSTETLGGHTHDVMSCRASAAPFTANQLAYSGEPVPLPSCNRDKMSKDVGAWICRETPPGSGRDRGDFVLDQVVPAGHYLMIGDNRDNSEDSRFWGFVPEENLVGKATRIWFNFDSQRPSVVNLGRIGNGIE